MVDVEVLEVIGAGTLAGAIPELPAAIIKIIIVLVLRVVARGAVATANRGGGSNQSGSSLN